jgi:GNAT superfamily N-acetyltransferase
MEIEFVNYRKELVPEIVRLWNESELNLLYPLTEAFWQYNTIGQGVNFQAADFIGAIINKQLSGFVLTRRFRDLINNPDMQINAKIGWISALVVAKAYRKQGIGTALLQKAEENLVGVTKIRLGGDVGHFFPGVPAELPTRFFEKRGYEFETQLHSDLHRSLHDWQTQPEPAGVKSGEYYFRQGKPGEEIAIIEFLAKAFPGRWRYKIALDFAQNVSPEDITLLKRHDHSIAGFLECRHVQSANLVPTLAFANKPTWGGIGPLGVDSTVRGGGLGLGIIAYATDYLKSLGVTDIIIDWTSLVDFYGKLGYTVHRTYRYGFKNFG